jgi:biopolymer transport protein ExbD
MAFDVGGSKTRVAPQMNVTPLVDVVLVLLIIFMVVTPLLTKKFWLNVPKRTPEEQAETPPPEDQKQLVLMLQKNGTILVNSEVIAKPQLGDKLARALAARRDGLLFFDADADAPYGEAVELMDIARGSGAATIAVVTKELTQ